MASDPRIELRKDGPFYRLAVLPPDALPDGWCGPSTFTALPIARMSAKLLAEASGLPIVDATEGR